MLILSIPAIQTILGKYATNRLNNELGTNINIGKVGLQFNGDVELKKIYVEDYKKGTLISIAELNTSILSVRNLINGKLAFGDIDITDLIFNIKTYQGETDTNLDVFVAKFEDDNPRVEENHFLMSSSDVSIYNGIFRMTDENKESAKLLEFENLNINATNFLINGSDVSTRINTLAFKDSRGFEMKNMSTNFSYSLTDMIFSNLDIKTPNSTLKGYLQFAYDRENFKEFADKVNIIADFKDSTILFDELNIFYNEFGKNQSATFNVDLTGTLNDLQISNLELNTSTNSKVFGNMNFKNLFIKETDNFYMKGDFLNLTSTYKDLKALLPNALGSSIPSSLDNLGKFTIAGQTEITSANINANIKIDTDLGFLDSKLEINKIDDIDNAIYKGNVAFENFDFGIFLNNPKLGLGSLNVDVKGQGFVAATINTQVIGNVFEIQYNDYNYTAIKVEGNIRNKIFDGNLISNDENLILNFNGLVDFSGKENKYDFEANIAYANLYVLNFMKKDSISILKSDVKMNVNGSTLDNAYGKISFSNTSYKNQNDTYYFEKFDISSRFENTVHFVEINSPDIIEGNLNGNFVFKDLPKLLQNSLGHMYTNYVPYKVTKNQYVDFNFKIYNKIIEVFYPEIEVGKNTYVRGRVENDEEKFRVTFKSPEIKAYDYFANDIELQIDNSNPLFNTYIEVDSINTKYYNVSKLNLINVTLRDTLFMRAEFTGGKQNNDIYNLSFYHTINEEKQSVVGFKTSDITIKGTKWSINEKQDRFNKFTFNNNFTYFNIDKLFINHENQELSLSGFIKDSTEKDLKLNFKNVDLAKITPDIDSLSLAGNVNGKLDLLQKNGNYLPNSTIVIDDFKVNDFELGSFDASITGNENLTNYIVDVTIKDDVKKSFRAQGDISVMGSEPNIDVSLTFNDFALKPLNPLLQDVLDNIRGSVTGDVNLNGNLKQPDINGSLTLNKSGFTIPYLNVDYSFADKSSVTLKDQSFIFNNIPLTDTKFNSKGQLNGSLSHTNFSKWALDLQLSTPRLLVLDTELTDESAYYGTGFIGGTATIKGPTDQLSIDVVGETKAGTVFKIPLNNTESFGDNSFIHFITKEEKEAKLKGIDLVLNDVYGLELDFDLDITEEAELEIIINQDTGHALRGRGNGNILLEINTNGKFNMWGDFSVFQGVYNFAYGGLIRKEFTVKPGGTIAWDGDPLNARINISAVYRTETNPSPLLDNPINRSIPVDLNISLTGQLEQPVPLYEFEFPNVNSAVKSELQYRLESEEDKQNQALYLLSTGSFSRGLSELNFSGTIAERLNGIINSFFSNGDGKLNIGLNYEVGTNRPDYRTDSRFDLKLQTKISDRVLINGKVGVPVGGSGANETVVAGDVQINFLLNEDGTLTANVFNRENSIRNFGEDIGYTQGVGLTYSVDFDTFKELIQHLFKKEKTPENLTQEEGTPQEVTPPQQEEVDEDGYEEEDDPNALPGFITQKPAKKEDE
ncbi:translocation/assembly module TamB domain-containing protein [Confluentibacter flavum]|uniref:N-acetyl-gamma-glutamyl-phosphate reductase n=1 Tax=Confluentibacter flavum TaxID=1909700 RepID=A0A2N3HN74_9FLAO|nr:translocation/assembly module TamB domain-containing protein [Confluentibacter flavum]PKQ46413.1 N-acetyl-gamma-glutamyl-phosphate reductase [Confluentibacter flavum]